MKALKYIVVSAAALGVALIAFVALNLDDFPEPSDPYAVRLYTGMLPVGQLLATRQALSLGDCNIAVMTLPAEAGPFPPDPIRDAETGRLKLALDWIPTPVAISDGTVLDACAIHLPEGLRDEIEGWAAQNGAWIASSLDRHFGLYSAPAGVIVYLELEG